MLIAKVAVLEAEATGMEEKLARINSGWFANRQADIVGDIGSATSSSAYRLFHKWGWADPTTKHPFVLQLNSGNGSYIDAFSMFDIIRLTQEAGHSVSVANIGMLGTHATILMQAANRRIMSPRSWLVLKEAQGVAQGNTNQHRDKVKFLRTLEEHGWRLLAERAGSKVTVEELKDRTYRGAEWWLSAEEALELGLIDGIENAVQVLPATSLVDPDLMPAEGDSLRTRAQKAETRKAIADAHLMRLGRIESLSSLDETGKVMLFDPVRPDTCANAAQNLDALQRRGAKDVEFLINSPGGCVVSGAGLMDALDGMKASGAKLTTTVYGYAASMGGFLSQTGTHRRMTKNSYFMIHQVSNIFGGSSSHMEDGQASMERLQEMLFSYMANRTGGKLPLADLKAKCNEHDWWLTPAEAEAAGLIDEII
jgi:ATP-dependent Clp endopeptidase proteolytic subunit ClpP